MATLGPHEPISHFRLETRDPDLLGERLSPLSGGARIEPMGPLGFSARLEAWKLPRTGLFRIELDQGRAIHESQRDFIGVTLPLEAHFEVHRGPAAGRFAPGSAHVLNDTSSFDLRSRRSQMLVANLDTGLVQSHVDAYMPDAAEGELEERLIASEPRAGSLLRYLGWVGRELQQEGTSLRMPLVAREVENALASLLVEACLDNDRGGEGYASEPAVRRAEEFLAASLSRPICLPDVARAAGVPTRTLIRAFTNEHGLGPIAFLRQRRLDAAHQDLLAATRTETSVTAVAVQYGFAHLGRFAAEYRRTFGELPSATLRRSG